MQITNLDELIQHGQADDPQVIEALMLEYYNPVYRLTGAILYDPAEAEDAAQETFIRAAASLDQYKAGTNLKNWLFKIAVNICRDRLRRQKARQKLMETLIFWLFLAHLHPCGHRVKIKSINKRAVLQEILPLHFSKSPPARKPYAKNG